MTEPIYKELGYLPVVETVEGDVYVLATDALGAQVLVKVMESEMDAIERGVDMLVWADSVKSLWAGKLMRRD